MENMEDLIRERDAMIKHMKQLSYEIARVAAKIGIENLQRKITQATQQALEEGRLEYIAENADYALLVSYSVQLKKACEESELYYKDCYVANDDFEVFEDEFNNIGNFLFEYITLWIRRVSGTRNISNVAILEPITRHVYVFYDKLGEEILNEYKNDVITLVKSGLKKLIKEKKIPPEEDIYEIVFQEYEPKTFFQN